MADPFTTVYQAIRTALFTRLRTQNLIEAGSFLDATDPKFRGYPSSLDAAHTPNLQLLQGYFRLMPFGVNSKASSMMQVYRVVTIHRDVTLEPVNKIKYQSLIALVKLGGNLGLGSLVGGYEITDGQDSLGPQLSPDVIRWTTIYSISVNMNQSRSDLLAS